MGVMNAGIAGNRLLSEVVGPSALARFDRDVLAKSGVTHIVLLEGINDLGLAGNGQPLPTAAEILAGHRQIVARPFARHQGDCRHLPAVRGHEPGRDCAELLLTREGRAPA
jgi:lysophospholipase L1-like esterase